MNAPAKPSTRRAARGCAAELAAVATVVAVAAIAAMAAIAGAATAVPAALSPLTLCEPAPQIVADPASPLKEDF